MTGKRGLLLVAMLACAAATVGCGRSAQTRRELEALRAQIAAVKLQAQATQDWTLIANLQASYGFYVDSMRWDDAADLFAKDATLEIAGHGLFEGQDRIRTYLHALGKLEYRALLNHIPLQPAIRIAPDGNSAQASWRTFMQAGPVEKEARRGEATYENEYVKEDGIWKIRKLHHPGS